MVTPTGSSLSQSVTALAFFGADQEKKKKSVCILSVEAVFFNALLKMKGKIEKRAGP